MSYGRLADLAWLAGLETRNRITGMLARLKDPKYLVAFLVGIAYFVAVFAPQVLLATPDDNALPPWAATIAPVGLAILVLYWWLRGGYEHAVAFRPEEVNFLFPAPLSRRTLIRYRLLRAQAGVIGSALLISVFQAGAQPWYRSLIGAWALVTTLHLHQVASSLVRLTAAQRGRGARRARLPLAVAALMGGILLWTIGRAVAGARSADDLASAGAAAMAALDSPATRVVLLPFRLLTDPLFAVGLGAWLVAMAGVLGLLVLHVMWVTRIDAAFEEAAAEAGQRRAAMAAAMRAGRAWWRVGKEEVRPVARWLRLPLAPSGEPALAVTWSHAMAFAGDLRRTTIGVLAGSGVAVFATMYWGSGTLEGAAAGMAMMLATIAGGLVVFGPLAARYDLRRDLARLEILRAWPIDPRWLVAAEIAAPVLLLSVVQAGMIGMAVLLLPFAGLDPRETRLALVLAALALANLPGLMALQVALQNALAVLFPGWVRIGAGRQGGIDAVGQGILLTIVALFLFAVLLVLPVVAAFAVGAAYAPTLAGWSAIPAAAAFAGAVWLEVVWLARWIARLYERLDPVTAGLLA